MPRPTLRQSALAFLLLPGLVLAPARAFAGQLSDLEKEMERPAQRSSSSFGDDDDCDGFLECVLTTILAGLAEAVIRSAGQAVGEAVDWTLFGPDHDEDREWLGTMAGTPAPPEPGDGTTASGSREPSPPPPSRATPERHGLPGATNRYGSGRAAGAPTIPFLRVDDTYALVPDDVDAYSVQAQAGYGAFGASFEFARFWEDRPASRLDSYSADVLFRFAAGEGFEFDIATGYRGFHGEAHHDGWEIGIPIAIYPWRYLGVESSFKWAFVGGNLVEDYRGGLAIHVPFVTLRPGYRHLATGDESLDGPELTLGVMW